MNLKKPETDMSLVKSGASKFSSFFLFFQEEIQYNIRYFSFFSKTIAFYCNFHEANTTANSEYTPAFIKQIQVQFQSKKLDVFVNDENEIMYNQILQ